MKDERVTRAFRQFGQGSGFAVLGNMTASPWSFIEPGQFVRHPLRPEWGLGQVQSAIGERITVNFEHAGKVLVNASVVALEICETP